MAVLPPDPVFSLRCPEMGAVNSICFHSNERLLAGTTSGRIFLWNLETNRSPFNFEVSKNPITSLHHLPDLLISQEKGGRIILWSISNTTHKYINQHTIEANHLGFCRTALLGDNLLFYPCGENTVGVLHVNDTDMTPQMLVPDDPQLPKLGSVACLKPFESASQIFLLVGYESGYFLTWDLSSGLVVDLLQLEADPMSVDYDPLTNRGIIGGPGDKLNAITYKRQCMQLQRGADIGIKNAGINCIKIREDQKIFATGGWDGRVRIFSWKSLRPLAVLTEHKSGGVMDIAYSVGKVNMWHSSIMATAGMDGQISLWDLYN